MYTALYRSGKTHQHHFNPPPKGNHGKSKHPPTERNISKNRIVKAYGPKRKREFPWARDLRLLIRTIRNLRPDEEPEDVPKDEPKEEKLPEKEFQVVKVDLKIDENTKQHRTDKYGVTKSRPGPEGDDLEAELVVRRGQAFTVTIHFNQPYVEDKHQLEFVFTTGKCPKPSQNTLVQFKPKKAFQSTDKWKAKIEDKKDNTVTVEITPFHECVIGEWMLSIVTSSDSGTFRYDFPDDITILLNPWCADDTVYEGNEALLNEYVLNDKGAIFVGNYKQIGARTWNFGQFEEGILEICLHLLRKGFGGEVSARMADPVHISRAISHIMNKSDANFLNDDEGVLVGNWSGDYTGGKKPGHWTGSVKILKQFDKQNGEPVCFGQCWVFSGIVTTVCRALGLPARSVTNFASAHDTDGSVSIDTCGYYEDEKFVRMPEISHDSVWNFHVWNEVWMTRPDLGSGCDGWQVIDATPQEVSDGVYCCGPAPVAAIKRGDCSVPYDTPFIFAEVNADKITWNCLDVDKWQKIGVSTNSVGRNISTKIPDGLPYSEALSMWSFRFREDITDHYKYREGTHEERIAVMQANRASKVDRELLNPPTKDIELQLVEEDGVMVGQPFTVQIKAKNICKEVRTISCLAIDVESKRYTGEFVCEVTKHSFRDAKLKPDEEKMFKFEVTGDVYIDKLVEQAAMGIRVTALIEETKAIYVDTDDFRLRRPDLQFQVPDGIKKGDPFELTITFKNHMPISLTECSLDLDGVCEDEEFSVENVKANTDFKHVKKVTVMRSGRHQISASFDCKELPDISGYINVELLP